MAQFLPTARAQLFWNPAPSPIALGTTVSVGTSKEKTVFLGEIMGPDFLIVVIIIAVLIFGGAAIPKLARNLGQAKNEFEKGLKTNKTTDDPNAKATEVTEVTDPNPPEADK
jgi:sec-independent protein translocase protein TatA